MAYTNQGCVQNGRNHQAITVSFQLSPIICALWGFIDSSLKELKTWVGLLFQVRSVGFQIEFHVIASLP